MSEAVAELRERVRVTGIVADRLDAGGRPAFDGDFRTWLAEHPHKRALFDLAMDEGTERRIERLDALEWRGDETLFGAHERTESEWRALADAAGLRVDAVHEALIEARCP